MEIFGIILSIPAAFVISMLYCLFVAKVLSRSDRLILWLRVASRIVLVLLVAEFTLVVFIGAVRSRAVLGPGFYVVHLALFFVCTPALANLLVFRHRARWYFVPFACTGLALFLVLFQYSVSESLYGINGDDGPYSNPLSTSRPSTDQPSH
ncbi:MAG TPA: hypothetical protein VGI45_02825 [Terracidiphilus sp.]|jgi:hypothetical protein